MLLASYPEELAFLQKGKLLNHFEKTAHWLKSDYDDSVWKIGSQTIYWNRGLPDETNLSDACNQRLLDKIKRIVYEIRNSPTSRNMADMMHYRYSHLTLYLLDYVMMHKEQYKPHDFYFSCLDHQGLLEFIKLLVDDGFNGVAFIKRRINNAFNKILKVNRYNHNLDSIGVPEYVFYKNTKNLVKYSFSDEDINLIRKWLYLNKFYEFYNKSDNQLKKGMINRGAISRLLGINNNYFSPKVDLYLRQFEFVDDYVEIELIVRFSNCEYIPTNSLLIEESLEQPFSESVIHRFEAFLATLMRLSDRIDGLPSKATIDSIRPEIPIIRQSSKAIRHYKTTPVPVALKVINESVRFFLTYGDSLVDYCLKFAKMRNTIKIQSSLTRIANEILARIPIPDALKPLNINTAISLYDYREYKLESIGRYAAAKVRASITPAIKYSNYAA